MTVGSRGAVYPLLVDISGDQGGYFLAAQASRLAISRLQPSRLQERGVLERDSRGLYRLAGCPLGEDSELWAAILWAGIDGGKPRGVLCYETALSMFDVSTVDPSQVDIALPKGTRLRRRGASSYRVRYRDYLPEEVTKVRGLPTTSLARTLLDLTKEYVAAVLKLVPLREGYAASNSTEPETTEPPTTEHAVSALRRPPAPS